ncbi:expressed unknown protein [Seminavis robusta]|uniref:Uncharacterized protein n=1 Tax=Seminavis robusta TaxID=568900 RepID=A0A9N8HHU0_9STRA|nr:expressed unknown protein [Seminavis robusta]|eukprot:Sro555_g165770.1 n/a (275) ;mRNA; r:46803-47833
MLSSSYLYGLRSTATARTGSIVSGVVSRRLGGKSKCQRFSSSSKGGTDALSLRQQAHEARQQRANQMHAEIASITQKQENRHVKESGKILRRKGFSEFLGKHKTNLSVVVVSFLTVVLSVKLVQGTHKYGDLEKEVESSQAQAEEMRQLLRSIGSQEYLAQLANRCARELNDSYSQPGRGWGSTKTTQSMDNMSSTITNILAQDIGAKIGDAALTEDQQSAKHIQELNSQPITGDAAIEKLNALQTPQPVTNTPDDQQWVQGDKNSKKKSVFVI